MNIKLKSTCLYGVVKLNSSEKKRFEDEKLFPQNMQYAILLKRIKIYFGNNIKNKKALLGFEASYINYMNGQKLDREYVGGEKTGENIEVKELIVENNDYLKDFEFQFDDSIFYINIKTSKGKNLEFGEKPDKTIKILNYEGDNMIQFFWGDYDKEGINTIGFRYIPWKYFIFGTIFPVLYLRYKLSNDDELKNKYKDNYKDLLKNNISMIYLYRACLLPDAIFSNIIKYC